MTAPVSFKLAKLLKENGFDAPCMSRYYEHGDNELQFIGKLRSGMWFTDSNYNNVKVQMSSGGVYRPFISAPTIAEVVMWLYKNHGIWIFILPQDKSSVDFRVDKSEYPSLPLFILIIKYNKDLSVVECLNSSDPKGDLFLHFDEPTEAYETAIEYCLTKLI